MEEFSVREVKTILGMVLCVSPQVHLEELVEGEAKYGASEENSYNEVKIQAQEAP